MNKENRGVGGSHCIDTVFLQLKKDRTSGWVTEVSFPLIPDHGLGEVGSSWTFKQDSHSFPCLVLSLRTEPITQSHLSAGPTAA